MLQVRVTAGTCVDEPGRPVALPLAFRGHTKGQSGEEQGACQCF